MLTIIMEFLIAIIALVAISNPAYSSPLQLDEPWSSPSETLLRLPLDYDSRNDVNLAEVYRLPTDTIPVHYDITLQIDPQNETAFSGTTIIKIRVLRPTKSIVLHGQNMQINERSIINSISNDNVEIESLTVSTDEGYINDTHFINITTLNTLEVGNTYDLKIKYDAQYGKDMLGVYISYYTNSTGIRRSLATTQFQPWHARSAFPCYDEPAIKAVFSIKIFVPDGYHAISNMDQILTPAEKEEEIEGYKLYAFNETPKMSTYLIAFVVSDFYTREGNSTEFKKPFNVYFREGQSETVDFAVEFGPDNLAAIENFVNFPYVLPKMDKIAIPDFSAGAMENWGLVTYREEYLMWTNGISTTRNKHNIGTIISHENGHMWFGNEVSPRWWDVLWLNEGFATYFEYYGTHLVHNDWRLMDQFNVFYHQAVMLGDSLITANAMTNPVYTPTQINGQFNSIAYSKAGSVIKMMAHVIGQQKFKEGLHAYVKENTYGVADPDTLYASLDSVLDDLSPLGGHSVKTVFSSWAEQPGYPVVEVHRRENRIWATQKRFFQNPDEVSTQKWYIPVNVATNTNGNFDNTSATAWLRPDINAAVIDTVSDEDEWYIVNKQESGYYRVKYDDENWLALAVALRASNFSGIPVLNRAQIIDDAMNFARSGALEYSLALQLLRFLEKEVDYIPWASANAALVYVHRVMRSSNYFTELQAYTLNLIEAVYKDVGFDIPETEEPMVTKYNRIIALSWACTLGLKDCEEKSIKELQLWRENENHSIHPDIQSVVFCTALRLGTSEDFDFLWNKYVTSEIASQRGVILANLGCTSQESSKLKLLNFAIAEDSGIRDQDRHSAVISVATGDAEGLKLTLTFLTNQFAEVRDKITSWSGIPNIINNIGLRLVNEEDIQAFDNFVASHSDEFTSYEEQMINAAKQNSKLNMDWQERYMPSVQHFLSSAGIPSASFTLLFVSVIALLFN